jgi:hypothetical protein
VTSRNTLLTKLLRPLVQEWGHGEAKAALMKLSEEEGKTDATLPTTDGPEASRKTRIVTKLTAVEQVARARRGKRQRFRDWPLALTSSSSDRVSPMFGSS